jgi:hypothetical protein
MNFTTTADSVMMFLILASMAIFDALSTLLSILNKGIFINQRDFLATKTNKELRAMLVDVQTTSKMRKSELINLVLLHA